MGSKHQLSRQEVLWELRACQQEVEHLKLTVGAAIQELESPKAVQLDFSGREVRRTESEETYERPASLEGPKKGPYGKRQRIPRKSWMFGAAKRVGKYVLVELERQPEGFPIVWLARELGYSWENVNTTCERLVRQNPDSFELIFRKGWRQQPDRVLKGIRRINKNGGKIV